ncbi:MAG: hypothetical protein KAU50_05370, partial [Candidatus Marinimicrobia bacterium]|nr:hypothetical protein [Candidatus Neomarinimicrobiota bacterium]
MAPANNNADQILERAVQRCRDNNIIIPTYSQMADPGLIPDQIRQALQSGIGLWDIDPLNLFRITW